MTSGLGVRTRMAVVLVAFSIVTIATVTILSGISVDRTMDKFGKADLSMTARESATLAAVLYERDGGWRPQTVRDIERVGSFAGEVLVVRDGAGRLVSGSPRKLARERADAPIVVRGRTVGSIALAHAMGGYLRLGSETPSQRKELGAELHDRLRATHAIAGALSAALALCLALLVAWRGAQPLRRLTDMAGKLEEGDIDGAIRMDTGGSLEHRKLSSTLHRAAVALKREDALRRETISAVAHELRTPLVGIRGRIEASQDGLIGDVTAALDAMHADVLRLVRLIEDIERLTEAQQPGFLISRAQLDLSDVAEARLNALEPHYARAGIALERDLSPARVNGDPERLGQIIDNLLSNALRYTDPGGRVLLSVRREGNDAVLEVEDTGIGIAEQDLPRVFDRFWRGDMSRSRATGGSGIGLALVQELVRGHDGEICVNSTPGEGTSFRVSMPAVEWGGDEPGLRYSSLAHYSTPAGGPLVVATVDPSRWRAIAPVEENLRRRIRIGEPVIIVDLGTWPGGPTSDAIDAFTRVHGEARARGGTLLLLAEDSAVRSALVHARAHYTIPLVSSVDQAIEELKDLGLLSSLAPAGGFAASER